MAERTLITMTEAARLLGYHRTSIYALVKRGDLPAVRIGPRSMLVDREAVLRLGARTKGRPRKDAERERGDDAGDC